MKKVLIIVVVVIVAVAAIIVWKPPIFLSKWAHAPSAPIGIFTPKVGDMITSPLSVSGVARGTWYFEASFPVRVLDANGKVLGSAPAHADADWMTENFVPFSGVVTFESPTTPTGTIVFAKDNPSGLPEHDAAVEVAVRFKNFSTSPVPPSFGK